MAKGLLNYSDVRALAARVGLRPAKHLGQNFVTDANTIRRLVSLADVQLDDLVLEVGPGLGSLTIGLLATGAKVTAVEIDSTLAELLHLTVISRLPGKAANLITCQADALTLEKLPGRAPKKLVANLPYNIAVPVVLTLLERFKSLDSGLVMVQLEVAQRLTAQPGSKIYGAPSAKLAWFAESQMAGQVPASVFWPVPKVASGLVRLRRRRPPTTAASKEQVFAVIDAAFAQRRKMLRSALSSLADASTIEAALQMANVAPSARGETLSIAEFATIAACLSK